MTVLDASTPYVICAGTSPEETAAVARAVAGQAVVIVAADTVAIRPLLAEAAARPEPTSGPGSRRDPDPGHGRNRLAVDRMLHQVRWTDQVIHLSPREFDLLALLAADTGRVWTFEEIITGVWNTRYLGDTDVLFSAVKRLRRRLAEVVADLRIVSVRGVGFQLALPGDGDGTIAGIVEPT